MVPTFRFLSSWWQVLSALPGRVSFPDKVILILNNPNNNTDTNIKYRTEKVQGRGGYLTHFFFRIKPHRHVHTSEEKQAGDVCLINLTLSIHFQTAM